MAALAHGVPPCSDLSAPMPELESAWQALPGAVLAVFAARHPFGSGAHPRLRQTGRGLGLASLALLARGSRGRGTPR